MSIYLIRLQYLESDRGVVLAAGHALVTIATKTKPAGGERKTNTTAGPTSVNYLSLVMMNVIRADSPIAIHAGESTYTHDQSIAPKSCSRTKVTVTMKPMPYSDIVGRSPVFHQNDRSTSAITKHPV